MVAVGVDRPVGEDELGLLGLEDLAKLVVPRRIHLRGTIDLTCEDGPCLEDLARLPALGGADRRGLLVRLACNAGLTPCQIEGDDLVAQVGEPGHRPAAAGLRVVGMAAHDDDLPLAIRRIRGLDFRRPGEVRGQRTAGARPSIPGARGENIELMNPSSEIRHVVLTVYAFSQRGIGRHAIRSVKR